MPKFTQEELDLDKKILAAMSKFVPVSRSHIDRCLKVGLRADAPGESQVGTRLGILVRSGQLHHTTAASSHGTGALFWLPTTDTPHTPQYQGAIEPYDPRPLVEGYPANFQPQPAIILEGYDEQQAEETPDEAPDEEEPATLPQFKIVPRIIPPGVMPALVPKEAEKVTVVEAPAEGAGRDISAHSLGGMVIAYLDTYPGHLTARKLASYFGVATQRIAMTLTHMWRDRIYVDRAYCGVSDELVYWSKKLSVEHVVLTPEPVPPRKPRKGYTKQKQVTVYTTPEILRAACGLPVESVTPAPEVVTKVDSHMEPAEQPIEPAEEPTGSGLEIHAGDDSRGPMRVTLQADRTILLDWPEAILAMAPAETMALCEFFSYVDARALLNLLRDA